MNEIIFLPPARNFLKKLKDIHEVETVRIGNALLIKLPNYLKYMSLPDKKKGKSARPQPSENPEPVSAESTNKESKEGNNFIRKENLYRPQVFSNYSNEDSIWEKYTNTHQNLSQKQSI